MTCNHDDVIKWKHFPRYWTFVCGIHRLMMNSPHKSQWHGALMFSLFCAQTYGSVNNRGAGDLRRQHGHYGVTVITLHITGPWGGNARATIELPSQMTSNADYWCFLCYYPVEFVLNKQPRSRWFNAPWHTYDVTVMHMLCMERSLRNERCADAQDDRLTDILNRYAGPIFTFKTKRRGAKLSLPCSFLYSPDLFRSCRFPPWSGQNPHVPWTLASAWLCPQEPMCGSGCNQWA